MHNDQDEEFKLNNTHFDAIKLLEGALQKMDGIISQDPISNTNLPNDSNVQQTELNNFTEQKNNDDSSGNLEAFKIQVAMLNNQVDVLHKKLNHLEKYLSQQSELRQKAENRLQEELIVKSKLETEKLEVIAMLTNLKLINLRLTKENMELTEMLRNNQSIQNTITSPCKSDILNSQFHRTKNHGSRFYCSLPRHISKKKLETKNLNTEILNDMNESCASLIDKRSHFEKCSSAPNLVDSKKTNYPNEKMMENNVSNVSSVKLYSVQNLNLTFGEQNRQQLQDWFTEQGIGYILQESKWPSSGKELMSASIKDIDEKFKFKHWLHRKKLILAIHCEKDQNKLYDEDKYLPKARYLNTAWVLQWLDDIGLPQYKDPFSQAAINGILLHRLTKDDFIMMQNGNSDLHFSSLQYGIKVLRINNFDPECLIRRSSTNKSEDNFKLSLWTTHRVMEWLCSVNLAEYASNLRGSGVHGGLIVYDDRFTSDLLADILFIQQSKTLLRRHLSIQFSQLIGKDLNQKKRDVQCSPKYRPLTISSKIKIQKRSQFSLKRKKSNNELAIDNLICPIND